MSDPLSDPLSNPLSDSPMAALYQALKEHTSKVRRDRRLAIPPADSVTVHSRLCGSQLTLDARIENNKLRELGFRVRSCALGQATTAIVADHAAGLDAPTLRHIHRQLQQILAGDETRCDWPELEIFVHVKDAVARHGSVLLPFRALEELFERAASRHANDAPVTEIGGATHTKE